MSFLLTMKCFRAKCAQKKVEKWQNDYFYQQSGAMCTASDLTIRAGENGWKHISGRWFCDRCVPDVLRMTHDQRHRNRI